MEIKKELVVKASPARVYKAITDPEQLTQWFPDVATLEAKVGGKVSFRFLQSKADNLIDKDYTMEGKVVELEENKNEFSNINLDQPSHQNPLPLKFLIRINMITMTI